MKNMIVSESNLNEVLSELDQHNIIFVDCETTGLHPYNGDVLFSFAVVGIDNDDGYYFNWNGRPDDINLSEESIKKIADVLFRQSRRVVNHNIKFDMHFLGQEGAELSGVVEDTWYLQRLANNQYPTKYSLDSLGKLILGEGKSKSLDEYCKKNKLFETVSNPDLDITFKKPQFNLVPAEIVSEYAIQDVRLTKKLYIDALRKLEEHQSTTAIKSKDVFNVAELESKVVKSLYRMEKRGVRLDVDFCNEANVYYKDQISVMEREFKSMTGEVFQKSPLLFQDIFLDEKEKWQYTKLGNASFTGKILSTFDHPVAKLITRYDMFKKNLDYFQTFLFFVDKSGFIHCNFNNAGTRTGRMSSSNPNLQNLTKPDKYEKQGIEDLYPVRRAFIPRDGHFFWMPDYDQMEYRMFVDMADAFSVIEAILKDNLDVHQALANLSGLSRSQAKNVNFAFVYGAGIAKLAAMLDKSTDEAKKIKNSLIKVAPELKFLIDKIISTAETRGHIVNWYGRVLRFPDSSKAYKAPNHYIQGGCADVVKLAMVKSEELLIERKLQSNLLLQIHDELVFEVVEKDREHLIDIKRIMETQYPHKYLPLTTSAEYSEFSLADKKDWVQ